MSVSTPSRYEGTVRLVRKTANRTVSGLTLGELRATVAAADGLADSAEVRLESLHADTIRRDEFSADVIIVREQTQL